jgi:hypothetical protein
MKLRIMKFWSHLIEMLKDVALYCMCLICSQYHEGTWYDSYTQNYNFVRGGKRGKNVTISTVNPADLGPHTFLITLHLDYHYFSY